MSITEKLQSYYTNRYLKKYGDRITQIQGNVVSVKIEQKTILWIFHKLFVTLIVRQERMKNVTKCVYKKNKFFKKPDFISVSQGNLVVVQGLKGKKGKENRELIEIMNLRNFTTKKDLVATDANIQMQKSQQRFR